MAEITTGFPCHLCGKHHQPLPLSFSAKAPGSIAAIPAEERAARVVISPDQCVIDQARYFLRGRIVVPILDYPEPFIWGVWAEVGPKTFLRTNELWKQDGRELEPPYRGWLDTELPLYESTLLLEVQVRTQVVGRRPHFELVSAEHPLAQEQREGITLARVMHIAALLLHADEPELLGS